METKWIWLAWDLLAVLVLVIAVYACAKKGLLRSVISALSYVISAVAAAIISPRVGAWIYDNVISEQVHTMVINAVEQGIEQGTASVTSGLPDWVGKLIEPFINNVNTTTFGEETKLAIAKGVDAAIRQPITWFIGAFVFLIIFLLLAIVLRWISKLFSGVNKIPLLGTANMALGGVLGVIQAAAILFVVAMILNIVITLTSNNLWWLNSKVLNSTFIMRLFYSLAAR